jgi:hypothetical protein
MDEEQATMEVSVNVQDIYTWRAYYDNNATDYLDESHAVAGFGSVDLARCTSITLINQANLTLYVVEVPAGAQAVFFRRRRVAISLSDESCKPQGTVHCIGWKRSDEEVAYLFVYEDGSALLSNNLQAG